jgi:ribose transport system ATP-binding protein
MKGTVSSSASPLVEMVGIRKHFPGVQALGGVDLAIGRGEVVGLAGENGSGKSSLMKVLAGSYSADAGEMAIGGEAFRPASPADAVKEGVAIVAQEVQVHVDLTVAENLLFGDMPKNALGLIRWREAERRAREVMERFGLSIEPRRRLGTLPLHQQHMISIAKMVRRGPRVLILDEPTASLPEEQVEVLSTALRKLRDEGTAIVYVTHRLREYFELCDRIVVLRDGLKVAEHAAAEIDEDDLVTAMVGRNLSSIFVRPEKPATPVPASLREEGGAKAPPPVLRVRGLGTEAKLADIDLDIAAGEIVGIAGQAGAGRSTLARAIFGVEPSTGTIEIDGEKVRLRSPIDAIAAGMGFVPEDRKGAGLVTSSTVAENLTMPSWKAMSRFGLRASGAESRLVGESIERLRIRTPGPGTEVAALSGGNQQKIVIAKWIARGLRLLILDEPTRGIDVGAKDEIYGLIDELAASGTAVLVLSSELLEVLRLSDRVVVMAGGRVVGEQPGATATEESITAMAFSGVYETEAVR